jgi:hypothetical protein
MLTPRAREKLDTVEATLLLSSLVYLVLFPCILQTCLVFLFCKVRIYYKKRVT